MTRTRFVAMLCGISLAALASVARSSAADDVVKPAPPPAAAAKPVRPWVVYVLPHSHVDIGYTDIQPEVERVHREILAKALELCRKTADYPPGARFKWNSEVAWPVDSYLRHASAEKQQQLVDAIHGGQVELHALYANELTGLCRPKDGTLLYRIRLGKSDTLAAIHYSPHGSAPDLPGFAPFYDRGAMVTPMYWGCHWPLSRGYPTGNAISELVHATPGSNCSIHDGTPKPIRSETGTMRDARGQLKTMQRNTWVWLIGMTDASDDDLRQRAHSFAHPPKLEAQGADVAAEPYSPERRALRLTVRNKTVAITIIPTGRCVNPVFELKDAPQTLSVVRLNDRPLPTDGYRWDGATLWLGVNLDRPATLKLEFADAGRGTMR